MAVKLQGTSPNDPGLHLKKFHKITIISVQNIQRQFFTSTAAASLCFRELFLHLLRSLHRPREVSVYNLTIHEHAVPKYRQFFSSIESFKHVYPFSSSLWYPNITVTTFRWIYMLNTFLFQWIPAILIDFMLVIARRQSV
jgi:hypothetical protein